MENEERQMDKVFVMDGYEKRLLIEGLNHCRTQFLEENKPIEDVNDMLLKVMKAKSKRISDNVVYRIKMKEYDYRVLIAALNVYQINQESTGVDDIATSKLIIKVIDAYGY